MNGDRLKAVQALASDNPGSIAWLPHLLACMILGMVVNEPQLPQM